MKLKSLVMLAGLALPLSFPLFAHGATRCLAMADAATGEWLAHEGQCDVRLPPMSTFKVAISLMGYDAGVLQDEHAPLLPFKEGYVDWKPTWRQPTDPASWMRDSVVWYSQQVTGRLGERRFGDYVRRFGYGNQDVAGDAGRHNGLTDAWLGSSLAISPDEQVAFLRRVANRELGVQPRAYDMTAALMQAPDTVDGWQVYGKTGAGSPLLADGTSDSAHRLGWYVGWLVKGERRIVFAQMATSDRVDGQESAGLQVKRAFLDGLPGRLSGAAPRIRAVVDAAILPVMAEHKLPGMAVAVTVDGKSYFFNYGVSSRASGEAVSENTLFELGSISKTFTATLGTYAQVMGKLALDDHPSRHLPALKDRAIDRATLLQLGTYTAGGLPLQFPDDVATADAERYFYDWQAVAAPGTQRRYSNPSIGLFGHLTARALGQDFAGALETVVFPAFGLRSTYVNVPPAAMPQYAWGYADGMPVRVNPAPLYLEAYGVKSSAADMLRFVQANLDPSGLAAPMRRAVEGTHVPYFRAGPIVQGLGWEQYPYPVKLAQLLAGGEANQQSVPVTPVTTVSPRGATLFQKTGSTRGFSAYTLFVPERRIGIVILANSHYPNPVRFRAAHAILSELAP